MIQAMLVRSPNRDRQFGSLRAISYAPTHRRGILRRASEVVRPASSRLGQTIERRITVLDIADHQRHWPVA